jgi:protein-S-isoprenylcysteine O-methyltransferase Ste14
MTSMNALELKIPPLALLLLAGVAMGLVSAVAPSLAWELPYRRAIALALAVSGVAVAVWAVVSFRRAGTTINPTTPQATSALVRAGIYRFSRNPMYLGFLLALLGWSVFLANALAFLFVPAFVVTMNRFQIKPEERVLFAMFGSEFAVYKQELRRWL